MKTGDTESGESPPAQKTKATIADLKAICGKAQVPTWDYTIILDGLILGGVCVSPYLDKLY